MSKKFMFFLALFIIATLLNKASAQLIKNVNDSTIIVKDGAVALRYNTYFIKSSAGKLIATFKGGQKIELKKTNPTILKAGAVDCVKIPCPSSFGSQTTCWECRPRPI